MPLTKEEQRAKHAAYMREYTARNVEKINAQRRARRVASDGETLAREKRWRVANREKVLVYKAHDRAKRPADYARWKRAWKDRHVEERHAKAQTEYQLRRTGMREQLARFRREHPDRYRRYRRAANMRHRVRKFAAPYTPISELAIWERDGGHCQICGRRVSPRHISLDHIVPLCYGGAHIPENVRLTHARCNIRRQHRGPAQLLLSL